MYIIKSFFREFGKVILSLGVIGLLCLGVYSIVTESYKVGKDVQSKKTVVQTIAILDLQAENSNLKTQIIELDGNNYTLKILTQTQQEEIDTLKGTITSLNSSLTSLRNEKEATDEVVSNLQSDIAYLNEYVAELEAQLGGSKNILVVYLPEEMNSMKKIYSARLSDDIVLLSSNQYIDSKIAGFWAYSISNKTFTRVINQGCDYSEVIHLSDKISLIRSTYFGCLLSYNHETQVYTTLIDYRQQYIYVKHIDTERQVCVIESNSYVYIYKFNTEEMIMINDYNSLAGLDKVLYEKSFTLLSNDFSYLTKISDMND